MSGWCVHCDNRIHIESDKLGRERTQTVQLTTCISVLNANVFSFDPSEVLEALSECVYLTCNRSVGLARQKAYLSNLTGRLLGERTKRPRDGGAAKECDEITTPHVSSMDHAFVQ